jgi:hypothetical protein
MSKQIIDIGIPESSRVEIADGLSRFLLTPIPCI